MMTIMVLLMMVFMITFTTTVHQASSMSVLVRTV